MDGEDPFVLSARFAAEQAVWAPQSRDSHGGIVAARYQAGGAREEAMEGFPTARKGAQSLKESGGDGLYALLRILEDIRDTNLLYRGGPEGMAYVHASASAILEMDQDKRKDALLEMDRECIRLNISPGGAADMLALACLIESVVPQFL
jgi:triphosphoribosyl-dephospho-CoA synthetase